MKISELKPCAICRGPLPPIWYVVRMSMALLDKNATNAVLGLNQIWSGNALGLAEVMVPGADEAVIIGMDRDKELMTEIHVCSDCYLMRQVSLAELSEGAAGTVRRSLTPAITEAKAAADQLSESLSQFCDSKGR